MDLHSTEYVLGKSITQPLFDSSYTGAQRVRIQVSRLTTASNVATESYIPPLLSMGTDIFTFPSPLLDNLASCGPLKDAFSRDRLLERSVFQLYYPVCDSRFLIRSLAGFAVIRLCWPFKAAKASAVSRISDVRNDIRTRRLLILFSPTDRSITSSAPSGCSAPDLDSGLMQQGNRHEAPSSTQLVYASYCKIDGRLRRGPMEPI
jgi:hypothetical protein